MKKTDKGKEEFWRTRKAIRREREQLATDNPAPGKIEEALYAQWQDIQMYGFDTCISLQGAYQGTKHMSIVRRDIRPNQCIQELVESIKTKAQNLSKAGKGLSIFFEDVAEDVATVKSYINPFPHPPVARCFSEDGHSCIAFHNELQSVIHTNADVVEGVVCHEMAHILRGDNRVRVSSDTERIPHFYDTSRETSTDLLAAILMGNPRKYARAMQQLAELCHPGILGKAESLTKYDSPNTYNLVKETDREEYMSRFVHPFSSIYQARAVALRRNFRWADILGNAGVTDDRGNVTNFEGALRIYSRACEEAQALGKCASLLACLRFAERAANSPTTP